MAVVVVHPGFVVSVNYGALLVIAIIFSAVTTVNVYKYVPFVLCVLAKDPAGT